MSAKMKLSLLVGALMSAVVVEAGTILVPQQQPTIQAGIDAASHGDTVLVAPGTYRGSANRNIDFDGKAITVRSTAGAENTIVDCQNLGRGFIFQNDEDESSVLVGFTIKDGRADEPGDSNGGGIWVLSGGPTIRDCVITSCHALENGGGLATAFSPFREVTLERCHFEGNTAVGDGGAVSTTGVDLVVRDCIFESNMAGSNSHGGAIHRLGNHGFVVDGSIFANNSATFGGAIWATDFSVQNCLFFFNTATDSGGAIAFAADLEILNCTIVSNTAIGEGEAIFTVDGYVVLVNCIVKGVVGDLIVSAGSGSSDITYSNVSHAGVWPGMGNINANPRFVSGPLGDHYLSQLSAGQGINSPCLDAGYGMASSYCFNGRCLDDATTRIDGVGDSYESDMGFHYPSSMMFGDGFESGNTSGWDVAFP